MLNTRFGVELEFTGITRKQAAETACAVLNGELSYAGTSYDTWCVKDATGRKWKFMSDASILTQVKTDGRHENASRFYSVKMVK